MLGALLAIASQRAAAQADTTPTPQRLWVRPVASLLLPGTGQLMAGQPRAAIYFAAELYLVARLIQLNTDANREAERFRNLAYDVARAPFDPGPRDTVFEYYETMERFIESGLYDLDPGAAFVPEADPTTYNGSMWLLARRTFWTNPDVPPDQTSPEYQRALQFYQSRAVGPGYQWSWRSAGLEHDEFRQSIRRSDAAFRSAQDRVGLLLANHVLSAVDAIISTRLSAATRRDAFVHTMVGPRGFKAVTVSFTF